MIRARALWLIFVCCLAAPAPGVGVEGLESRLAALDPADPMAYFELAEEVAYEMPGDAAQDLARRLLVLSFELDRGSDAPVGLGRSVCLALADLAVDAEERRWLVALGETFEGGASAESGATEGSGDDDDALALADALARLRAGDVVRARRLLRRVDASETLARAGLPVSEASDLASDLARASDGAPRGRAAGGDAELDPATGGNPGPSLDGAEFLRWIRAELALLGAEPRSWAAQTVVDRGRPLRDLDPGELRIRFGVDPGAARWAPGDEPGWRSGRWVATGATPPAE